MRTTFFLLFCICTIGGSSQSIIAEHVMPGEYYYDYSPDYKYVYPHSNVNPLPLDINNDGVTDLYVFHYYGYTTQWGHEVTFGLQPTTTTQISELTSDTCRRQNDSSIVYISSLAFSFPYHQTINRNGRWIDSAVYLVRSRAWITQFYDCGAGSFDSSWRWAGVRIFTPDTLYGWIKMKIVDGQPGMDDTLMIDSYACQTHLTGIYQNSENSELRIYPNPSDGKFFIDALFDNATLRVMDMTGRVIIEKKILNERPEVDLSVFDNGSYFISITDEKRELRSKLILVK